MATDLNVSVVQAEATGIQTPLLVLQFFEREAELRGAAAQLDAALEGLISRVVGRDFNGRKDETLVLYPPAGRVAAERILLVGVGKPRDYTLDQLRRAVGSAVRQAEKLSIDSIALVVDVVDQSSEHMGDSFAARGAIEAAVLASWDFREYKSRREGDPQPVRLQQVTLVATRENQKREYEEAASYALISARAENFARELQTRPCNEVTPTYLANVAQEIGREHGIRVSVLGRAEMEAEGMRALLAVAQGSVQEPRFIIMEYQHGAEGAAPLVLVGKGVTFDTGGISIKPAANMEDMKFDMSGAAAVIAAMRAIAELKLPVNVVGLVPSTENMPSGSAYKPGDVIRAHSGKTIEIVNTDAEGRLILADALSYAQRYKPAALVNAATLTGAVVIALGAQAIGLMGNDGDLQDELRAAGQRVGERCWPLPLWDEYRPLIDSSIADMKNSGGRSAGTITAGWFLKEFAGDTPWAHLDIAGTAYRDDALPYLRKGATGIPTRLFIEWVRSRANG